MSDLFNSLSLPDFVTRHLSREGLLTTCGSNLSNSLISVSMDTAGQRHLWSGSVGRVTWGNDMLFNSVVDNTTTTL